jgi:hypothetical protein
MLYQNALSSNVSLVTIEVETSGSYTAKPHEISGLPASDHLVPVSMPFGSDLCVVAYNKNKIALYKIDRDQKRADLLIHPQTWVSGWTTFAPLADGYSFVCLNAKTGAIGGVQVAPDQMRLHIAEGHPLPGYNSLAGLVGSEPFFVAYTNSNNLTPQIFSIQWQDPLKLNPKPSEDWPPNINWIATFEVAEKIDKSLVYFLIHQTLATSGLTRSTAPSLAGTSSSLMISSGVKPGWPDPPPPRRRGR